MELNVVVPHTYSLVFREGSSVFLTSDASAVYFNANTGGGSGGGVSYDILVNPPASPTDGDAYINYMDDTVYVRYGSMWQALHVLVFGRLELETADFLLKEDGDKLKF